MGKFILINFIALVAALGVTTTMTAMTTHSAEASLKNPKVTICHNGHEITVAEESVAKHVAEHGDDIGPCQPNP